MDRVLMKKKIIITSILAILSALGIVIIERMEHPFFVALVTAVCTFFVLFNIATILTQKKKK